MAGVRSSHGTSSALSLFHAWLPLADRWPQRESLRSAVEIAGFLGQVCPKEESAETGTRIAMILVWHNVSEERPSVIVGRASLPACCLSGRLMIFAAWNVEAMMRAKGVS